MKLNIKIKDLDKFLESIEIESELSNAQRTFKYVNGFKSNPYLEIKTETNTRTSQQNRALHKLFSIIADMLNDLGMTYKYSGVSGREFEIPYNGSIVKDYFWRPIQIALTNKQSTTELSTQEMNEVFNVICKFFSDLGHQLYFPSANWQSFEEWYKNNRYDNNNV